MLHRVIFLKGLSTTRVLFDHFFDFTLRMDPVYIAMFVLIESMKVPPRVATCDIFGGVVNNVRFL